ncbi:MAG TPA: zf-HC2 domain-containing protein [Frankiaceae bacterium]|nr:zf-HC2 domain-containing protein [Frankiaceae bacterium]
MTHDEVRELLGAVADGEAARTADLAAHLRECVGCAAYDDALARLSTLTAALPRERAPETLPARVTRRIRRRRRARWYVPALAAATAALVALPLLPGPQAALTPLPPAAAAEPLLTLRSLYVERTVTSGEVVSRERIWWRAPSSVRIERRVTEPGGGSYDTLTIETPGRRYAEGELTTGLPPSIALPEPLSVTAALLGADRGPGPVVAGMRTRTYEVVVDGETRTAHVADGIGLGGTDSSIVLSKTGGRGTVKTTQKAEVNAAVPDSLFEPPLGPAPSTEAGFAERDLGDLAIEPVRRPEGFEVVRAGSGPDGEAVLLARGSLPVLVTSGGLRDYPEVRTVVRGVEPYYVGVDLYAAPAVQVQTEHGVVTVSAPLPLDSLVELAVEMYGVE